MREKFEELVAIGKLSAKHVDSLVTLAESGYCLHKSWGFGKIASVDTVGTRFLIDFPSKNGHPMELTFAAETLKAIGKDHILARKHANVSALRQMAALNHLDLIKLVMTSFNGRATPDQIQNVLVPDVIQEDWKKWWETAKKEMKKDGHFQVPTKKSEPILFQTQEVSLSNRLLTDFRAAKGLKSRTAAASEIFKNVSDLPDKVATISEVFAQLNSEIVTYQRTQPAVALEAIFVRDDLREVAGLPKVEGEVTPQTIWTSEVRISTVLEALTAAKHRRALESFKAAVPGVWEQSLLANINNVSTKLASEIATTLMQSGKIQSLKDTLARLISQHQASSELLLWLAKERSDEFADILGPEVFRAMLTAMERDQFNEKRSNKLRDFILDDQKLLVELLASADFEVIKDVTRTLQLSPSFDDMDKRSLLARIVKSYPAVQSLISGADQGGKQDRSFQVSWGSLERRKNEYTELVQKQIPANSKEIAIARSYGDLRENHEYKAAKEMQKILMRRKSELERDLSLARGTDFATAKADVVGIGTKVQVTEMLSKQPETYVILGAWDSDPDHDIISYLTPIALSLLNKKVGEEADFEMDGMKKHFRVESISLAQLPESAIAKA